MEKWDSPHLHEIDMLGTVPIFPARDNEDIL